MIEELKTQVSEAIDSTPAPVAEKESKEVSSPDVKEESKPSEEVKEEIKEEKKEPEEKEKPEEKTKVVDEWKLSLQIENLNKAISIERDEKWKLREELDKVKPFVEKLQNAFNPEEVKPEVVEPKFMTEDQLEDWYSKREQEKTQESEQKQLKEKLDTQIKTMEEKWDWEDWKPKYSDEDVVAWQRENSKLYLMPEEAFLLMNKDDIINWETKQILSKKKWDVSAEKPSWVSSEHSPESITPKSDQEIKSAILEALSSVDEA